MSISLCIPYIESDHEKRFFLNRLLNTVTGYDELILIWNDGLGFAKPVNMAFELAKGDFIVHVSDDIYFDKLTDLKELVNENGVSCPQMVGRGYQKFWGNCWATPRWVYEKIGMFPKEYEDGLYYEDEEYCMNLNKHKIPIFLKKDILFHHPEGGKSVRKAKDLEQKAEHNRQLFISRWGVDKSDASTAV